MHAVHKQSHYVGKPAAPILTNRLSGRPPLFSIDSLEAAFENPITQNTLLEHAADGAESIRVAGINRTDGMRRDSAG